MVFVRTSIVAWMDYTAFLMRDAMSGSLHTVSGVLQKMYTDKNTLKPNEEHDCIDFHNYKTFKCFTEKIWGNSVYDMDLQRKMVKESVKKINKKRAGESYALSD